MRLAAFIISLLLLDGAVDPTRGWLIALVVVTGIAMLRPRFEGYVSVRPAVDLRLASFIFAVLLLAGTVDATKDWLIGLSILTGFTLVSPRMIAVDVFGERERRRGRRWSWTGDGSWDWGDRASWEIEHWRGPRRERGSHGSRSSMTEEDWP